MLGQTDASVSRERSARKEPLQDREVRALLRNVRTVIVARGQKAESFPGAKVKPADLKGPTGNYRAPMILKGKTLLVGFNRDALRQLV